MSMLTALAMVRNGASGATAAEMDRALRLPALSDLNAGMNLIDQTLAKRSGKRGAGTRKGKVELDLANAVWGQQGYTWEQPFLEVLASDYGTGVHPTDFAGNQAAARRSINTWVADRTHDKITDIATPDVVNADTASRWSTPSTPGRPGPSRSSARATSRSRSAESRCRSP